MIVVRRTPSVYCVVYTKLILIMIPRMVIMIPRVVVLELELDEVHDFSKT